MSLFGESLSTPAAMHRYSRCGSSHYPLQTYLQTIVVDVNLTTQTPINLVANITQKNSKSAQIIIAMLPILVVYPFLQKYFTKGIILGSVKG